MHQDNYLAHPLWRTLQGLDDAVKNIDTRDERDAEAANTFRFVISSLREHQEPVDFEPYSLTTLNVINKHLQTSRQELARYLDNKNAAHLKNGLSAIDNAKHSMGLLPPVPKSTTAAQSVRSFVEFRRLAEETIEDLHRRNAQLNQDMREQAKRYEEQQRVVDKQVTELTEAAAGLRRRISQDETRLDALLTDTNQRFTDKQTERDERFKQWLDKTGEQVEELASEHIDNLSEMESKGEEKLRAIDELREGTETVASLATGDALSLHYAKYARSQWLWGLIVTGLGILGLLIAPVLIFWFNPAFGTDATDGLERVILNAGVTAAVIAAGAVGIRIGNKFLATSREAKELELELRAIGPFLADVNPEKVQDTKTAFVERRFGVARNTVESNDHTINITAFDHVVSTIRDLMQGGKPPAS